MTERGRPPDDVPETTAPPSATGPRQHRPTAELTPPPTEGQALDEPDDTPVTRLPEGPSPAAVSPTRTPAAGHSTSDTLPSFKITGKPHPGQVLFGRYRIDRELGEGGMGSVWLVQHLGLDSPRALKLIVAEIAADDQVRARFKREARVMARLTHPNAVTVHDSKLAKDAAFIEMEYVRGQSLNRMIRPGQPMPVDWVARILEQLCDVLQEAHGLGIVHRDLKPSNLMLVEGRPAGREHLKVLDFGIAKLLTSEGSEGDDLKTQTNTFIGTAHYSSPEQIRGADIDARSDLYSAGVILYEFLTGQRPFSGTAQMLICDHLTAPPPPFAVKDPRTTVPPEVERVVLRCLSKDPNDRPQTARDLADEFLQAVNGGPSTQPATPATPITRPRPEPPRTVVATPAPAPEESHRLPPRPAPVAPNSPAIPLTPRHRPQRAPARKRGPRLAWPIASFTFLLMVGVVGIAANRWNLSKSRPDSDERVPHPGSDVADSNDGSVRRFPPPPPPSPKALTDAVAAWAAAGISPVAEDGRTATGWPRTLRRRGRLFRLSETGHYLPDGYKPESDEKASDGWPRVLIRSDGKGKARFIRIAGDTFRMGWLEGTNPQANDYNHPRHPVELSGFYMQETEVTNGEFGGQDAADLPAAKVTHQDAARYCADRSGDLPTEAQWEFAARSRSTSASAADGNPFVWSYDPAAAGQPMEKLCNAGGQSARPARSYPRDLTREGLYDMAGNVQEWCRDVAAVYPETAGPVKDPAGPAPSGGDQVEYITRGGSYDSTEPEDVRTTTRSRRRGGDESATVGFRMVLEPPASSPAAATLPK